MSIRPLRGMVGLLGGSTEVSVVASVHIGKWIGQVLGIPVVADPRPRAEERLDVLILPVWPLMWAKHIPEWERLVLNARTLVWVQNDYTMDFPLNTEAVAGYITRAIRQRREAGGHAEYWLTVPRRARPGSADKVMNWNCITYNPKLDFRDKRRAKDRAVYWGAFRKQREESFTRYFSEPEAPVVVFAPRAAAKKFQAAYGTNVEVRTGLERTADAGSACAAALYLEDERQHREFHQLATRWYEYLSYDMATFVDVKAANTFAAAGYRLHAAQVVDGPAALRAALPRTDAVIRHQRRELHKLAYMETLKLRTQVRAAWAELKERCYG